MISVVIPAYNEERLIGQCLDAFARQRTRRAFEVIVVDNASTDRTARIVRSYASRIPVRVVSEPRKGRGQARKTGFENAQGDIIASTDADTVVPANWIETIAKTFERNRSLVGITGTVRILDCDTVTNKMVNVLQPAMMRVGAAVVHYQLLNGFNFAVRAEAYRQSGGFDASLAGMEDYDLARKIGKVGKTAFVPSLTVTFSGRRFKQGFMKGVFDYAKSFARYVKPGGDGYLGDVR